MKKGTGEIYKGKLVAVNKQTNRFGALLCGSSLVRSWSNRRTERCFSASAGLGNGAFTSCPISP